jgi:hypothetical protein
MTGITTINLGGQQRTLSFKNNFILLLGVNLGVDPIDAPKKIEEYCVAGQVMRALTIITYCGIVASFERQYIFDHGITIAKVSEWCDDADQNEFTSVWDSFAEIMGIPKATEKQIKAYEDRLKKNNKPAKKNSQLK